jgi:uroporphyrinogen-III synthase
VVDVVDAYRNVLPQAAPGQLRQALMDGMDAATFTSSSSVTHLAEAARLAGIAWPFQEFRRFRLGPLPAKRCESLAGNLSRRLNSTIFPD